MFCRLNKLVYVMHKLGYVYVILGKLAAVPVLCNGVKIQSRKIVNKTLHL